MAGLALFALLFAFVPLREPQIPVSTEILDVSGNLIGRLYEQNRIQVSAAEIPRDLKNAVVAVEDSRFYSHFGIDPYGIARAMYRNIRAGRLVEGGSTITQQLAKNLFLTPKRTLSRKILEAVLTLKLEANYSKQEILGMYLNQIYLGHGSYGVEVAAQTYFGKKARDLTLVESAMIAGLPRGPEYYSPYRNPDAALERRNFVLDRMAELGYLTPELAAAAKGEPIKLAGLKPPVREAPYFVQYLLDYLRSRYPEIAVEGGDLYRGGYKVYTSLDLKTQRAAQAAFAAGLGEGTPDAKGVPQPQGALVALDPSTGYIRAMVGGRDFSRSPFNRAVSARRQPGSAFKPFLYTAVLSTPGFTAGSTQVCEYVSFPGAAPGQIYEPKDFGDVPYHWRPVAIREAIRRSDNVVAVRWAYTLGPKAIVNVARAVGIESPLVENLPLALGSSPVTPLEMAAGFAPFSNGGSKVRPIALVKLVNRDGRVLEENRPVLQTVVDEKVAFILTDIMKDVLYPGGTAAGTADTIGWRPAAGKTGTTTGSADAWFVGFTRELVAAVYVGNDDPSVSLTGTGATIAAPIWASFIRDALRDVPYREFPRPPGVVPVQICTLSGLLPNPSCPTGTEWFIDGTQPAQVDPAWHWASGASPAPSTPPGPPGPPGAPGPPGPSAPAPPGFSPVPGASPGPGILPGPGAPSRVAPGPFAPGVPLWPRASGETGEGGGARNGKPTEDRSRPGPGEEDRATSGETVVDQVYSNGQKPSGPPGGRPTP